MLAARFSGRPALAASRRSRSALPVALIVRCISHGAPQKRKSKVYESVDEAVKDVKSGDTILCGGERRSSYHASVVAYLV